MILALYEDVGTLIIFKKCLSVYSVLSLKELTEVKDIKKKQKKNGNHCYIVTILHVAFSCSLFSGTSVTSNLTHQKRYTRGKKKMRNESITYFWFVF